MKYFLYTIELLIVFQNRKIKIVENFVASTSLMTFISNLVRVKIENVSMKEVNKEILQKDYPKAYSIPDSARYLYELNGK